MKYAGFKQFQVYNSLSKCWKFCCGCKVNHLKLKLKLCKSLGTSIRTTDVCVDLWFACSQQYFACLEAVMYSKATATEKFEFGWSDIKLCAEFIDLCNKEQKELHLSIYGKNKARNKGQNCFCRGFIYVVPMYFLLCILNHIYYISLYTTVLTKVVIVWSKYSKN